MTKHNLSTAVDAALKAAGAIKVYVMTSGKLQVKKPGGGSYWLTFQESGTPDRLAIIQHPNPDDYGTITDVIYVEIKDKGDRLQPSQVERFAELAGLGLPVYVCHADPDDSEAAGRLRGVGVVFCHGAAALLERLRDDYRQDGYNVP